MTYFFLLAFFIPGSLQADMQKEEITENQTNLKIDGFKLQNIQEGGVFDKIGLQNGDILHSINGVSVSSKESFLQALKTADKSMNLQITRDQVKKTLKVDIK